MSERRSRALGFLRHMAHGSRGGCAGRGAARVAEVPEEKARGKGDRRVGWAQAGDRGKDETGPLRLERGHGPAYGLRLPRARPQAVRTGRLCGAGSIEYTADGAKTIRPDWPIEAVAQWVNDRRR